MRSISIFATLIFCCHLARAQSETGWIRGTITDKATASAIEDVEVTATNPTGIAVFSQSSVSGEFLLTGLPPGEYELTFRKDTFPEHQMRAVLVRAGCETTADIEMEGRGSPRQPPIVVEQPKIPSRFWTCVVHVFDRQAMERFPSTGNIWNLLQNRDPSSVTQSIDEGGIRTGMIQLVGGYGNTWTQTGYRWDGLNITNPYEPGKPLTYAADSTLQEFRVATAYHPAQVSAAGTEFEMTSRRGGGTFHGQAEVYYLGDPLQSSNLDSRLRNFGFQTTPHFKHFPEAKVSLGGSVFHRQQWSYFAFFGIQHMTRVVPDFTASPKTNVDSGLLRLDGALGSKDEITGLISGQIVKNSHLDAQSGNDPLATLLGNDRFELLHGHWTHRYSSRSSSELSFGFSHSSPTDTLQHGMVTPSYIQLFTGKMTGAAPLESDAALSRFSLLGQTQSFRNSGGNWSHEFQLGFDLEESLATEERRVFNGIQLFLFPGTVPAEVAEFNSPSHAMQRLRELSFFAGDNVNIDGKIFLRTGLNLDSSAASLPKQVSGAGPFAPVRTFPGSRNVVSWTSVSPRVSLTVPLWKRFGDTKFTAGYARYYHVLPASLADFANPNALGGKLYHWEDQNGDGVFQPGEEGTLLRVFGGPFSSIDPNLQRPFTQEWGFGLVHDLGRQIQMGVRLVERDSKRLVQTVNIGVPFSAYRPVHVLDPGDDGVPGTSDDSILTVFDQDPNTLGQDRYLLTNPAGLRATYKGLEANMRGHFTGLDFFSISFTAFKSVGNGNPGNSVLENDPAVVGSLFDDPNTLIHSRGRLFFDRAYVAKVEAYKQFPLGFRLASVVSYFDGLPFGRKLIVPDLNQGPFFVMATPRGEPGGFRTQYNLTLDQRLSRGFEWGRLRVSVIADIFNLLNVNKSLREFDVTGPEFAQRQPLDVENPRAFRLGAKFAF